MKPHHSMISIEMFDVVRLVRIHDDLVNGMEKLVLMQPLFSWTDTLNSFCPSAFSSIFYLCCDFVSKRYVYDTCHYELLLEYTIEKILNVISILIGHLLDGHVNMNVTGWWVNKQGNAKLNAFVAVKSNVDEISIDVHGKLNVDHGKLSDVHVKSNDDDVY